MSLQPNTVSVVRLRKQDPAQLNDDNTPWNEEAVVIMNPDKVPRFIHLGYLPGEGSICGLVIRVVRVGGSIFCGDVLPQEVVEQRP